MSEGNELRKILKRIEKEHEVVIIYACEYGEKTWGIVNDKIDRNIRFIYLHSNENYLKKGTPVQLIEDITSEENEAEGVKLINFQGYDIFKFINLAKKNSFIVAEMLKSNRIYYGKRPSPLFLREFERNFSRRDLYKSYIEGVKNELIEYNKNNKDINKLTRALKLTLNALWVKEVGSLPEPDFIYTARILVNAKGINKQMKDLSTFFVRKTDANKEKEISIEKKKKVKEFIEKVISKGEIPKKEKLLREEPIKEWVYNVLIYR